jgi:hypothetical protein
MSEWVESLVGAGRFEEATMVTEREYRDESAKLFRLSRIAAAQGDASRTRTLLDEFERATTSQDRLIIAFATGGQRERANEIAAEIDAAPYGYLTLSRAIHSCYCGAPFDLDATPNFAQRIEEAEFPWPPPSPINWPLKDW